MEWLAATDGQLLRLCGNSGPAAGFGLTAGLKRQVGGNSRDWQLLGPLNEPGWPCMHIIGVLELKAIEVSCGNRGGRVLCHLCESKGACGRLVPPATVASL